MNIKYFYCYGCGAKSEKNVFRYSLCRVCYKFWTDCDSDKMRKRRIDKFHDERKRAMFDAEV